MRISVVTIFPQMFHAVTDYGVVGRAVENNLVSIEPVDLRSFGQGQYKRLDDRPFGGGPGMVMLAEPIVECIGRLRQKTKDDAPVIYLSPQGKRVDHQDISKFSKMSEMILLCGRYEGIDQRALDIIGAEELSIGDYVISGGELAAMVLIDAVVRQIPGVLGNEQSSSQDSFTDGLLDCIHYTRPKLVAGHEIRLFAIWRPRSHTVLAIETINRTDLAVAARFTGTEIPEQGTATSIDRFSGRI